VTLSYLHGIFFVLSGFWSGPLYRDLLWPSSDFLPTNSSLAGPLLSPRLQPLYSDFIAQSCMLGLDHCFVHPRQYFMLFISGAPASSFPKNAHPSHPPIESCCIPYPSPPCRSVDLGIGWRGSPRPLLLQSLYALFRPSQPQLM